VTVDAAVDISLQLDELTQQQQQFERNLAHRLAVDAAGLAAMERLVRQGPATPTELAHHLGISTATTTLVIDRLEAAEHVTRSPHPTDGRKTVITAASRSAETAYGYVEPLTSGIDRVAAALTELERAHVTAFLRRVNAVYDDANRSLTTGRPTGVPER